MQIEERRNEERRAVGERRSAERRIGADRRCGTDRRSGHDRREVLQTASDLLHEYGADALLDYITEMSKTADDEQLEELQEVRDAIETLLTHSITKTKM